MDKVQNKQLVNSVPHLPRKIENDRFGLFSVQKYISFILRVQKKMHLDKIKAIEIFSQPNINWILDLLML